MNINKDVDKAIIITGFGFHMDFMSRLVGGEGGCKRNAKEFCIVRIRISLFPQNTTKLRPL